MQLAAGGQQEFAELAFSDRGLSSHPSQRSKAEHERLSFVGHLGGEAYVRSTGAAARNVPAIQMGCANVMARA